MHVCLGLCCLSHGPATQPAVMPPARHNHATPSQSTPFQCHSHSHAGSAPQAQDLGAAPRRRAQRAGRAPGLHAAAAAERHPQRQGGQAARVQRAQEGGICKESGGGGAVAHGVSFSAMLADVRSQGQRCVQHIDKVVYARYRAEQHRIAYRGAQ